MKDIFLRNIVKFLILIESRGLFLFHFFFIPIKSMSEPLLKSIVSPDTALIFILTIPSISSMQVRFQMSSFRIAIILVWTSSELFSLISFLKFGSRSSMSTFIYVVCFEIFASTVPA